MNKKIPAHFRFAIVHSAFCLLTLRYFVSVFSGAIKSPCMRLEQTGAGAIALRFDPELLQQTLPYYLPAAVAVLFPVLLSLAVCIADGRRALTNRQGLIAYSAIAIGAAAEIGALWLLENRMFGADSVNFGKLSLSCFLEAKYYSPFGLFGEDGIDLTFLTASNAFDGVKYLIPALVILLSLILVELFAGAERRRKREGGI